MSFRIIALFVLSIAICNDRVQSQSIPKQTPIPENPPQGGPDREIQTNDRPIGVSAFEDQFLANSLSEYHLSQGVKWQPGVLDFDVGDALGRLTVLEQEVDLQIDLEPVAMTVAEPISVTVVTFEVRGGNRLELAVMRDIQKTRAAVIAASNIFRGPSNNPDLDAKWKRKSSILRQVPFRLRLPAGRERWTFKLRYGLITIFKDGRRLGTSSIDLGFEPLKTVYINQRIGSCRCHRLSVQGPAYSQDINADDYLESIRLFKRSSRLAAKGRLRDAIKLTERHLQYQDKLWGKDSIKSTLGLGWLAGYHLSLNEPDLARATYQRSLEVLRQRLGPHHPEATWAEFQLARVEQWLGDLKTSGDAFQNVYSRLRKTSGPKHPRTTNVLAHLTHNVRQQYLDSPSNKGIGRLSRLLAETLATIRRQYGPEHWHAVNTRIEYEYFRRLLDMPYEERRHLIQADRDHVRARQLHHDRKFAEAIRLRKSIQETRAKKLGADDAATGDAWRYLGESYFSMEDFPAAMRAFEAATKCRRAAYGPNHPHYADMLNRMGSLLMEIGDYGRAEGLLLQALEVIEPQEKDSSEIMSACARYYNSIGAMHSHGERPLEAIAMFAKAVEAFHQLGHDTYPSAIKARANLAKSHMRVGQTKKARQLLEEALGFAEQVGQSDWHVDLLTDLGEAYRMEGDLDSAEECFESALRLHDEKNPADHPERADFLVYLGRLRWAQRRYDEAAELFSQALPLDRAVVRQSTEGLTELQRILFKTTRLYNLDLYLAVTALDKFSAEDVYQHVLEAKGEWYNQAMRMRRLRSRVDIGPLLNELQTVVSQLTTLLSTDSDGKLIQLMNQRKEVLEAEVARRSAQTEVTQPPISVARIQKHLPPEAVLIDFVGYAHRDLPIEYGSDKQAEASISAFVVLPHGPVHRVNLGPTQAIADGIIAWRTAIHLEMTEWRAKVRKSDRRSLPTVMADEESAKLRQLIWEPLAPYAGDSKVLIICPDTVLAHFPFAALADEAIESYLIEKMAVVTLPSAQLLPHFVAHLEHDDSPKALLIGDIDYNAAPNQTSSTNVPAPQKWFSPIPDAARQIGTVQRYFKRRYPNGTTIRLRGDRAREADFRKRVAGARFIHLSTHGFSTPWDHAKDQHRFLLSGLALTGANPRQHPTGEDDGVVRSIEASYLDLQHAELVVLAACQTSLGMPIPGEGIFGVQRSFQMAGARSTIGTLWPVENTSTNVLFQEFYRNLWEKKLGKAEALRQAQISLLRRYNPIRRRIEKDARSGLGLSPYYWAAFVLSGDWR